MQKTVSKQETKETTNQQSKSKLSTTQTETIHKSQEEQMLKENDFQLELYTNFILAKIEIEKKLD